MPQATTLLLLLNFLAYFTLPQNDKDKKTMKIKLTYFDLEGAAEPTRLALTLAGKEFEDERIKFPQFKELKPKLPYGQLPVMTIDDGPMKTQTGAMLRWAGAEFSETLYPRDKLYEVEEAIGVLEDLIKSWAPKMYTAMSPKQYGRPEDFGKTDEGKEVIKTMRTQWIENELPIFLGRLEGLLEKSGGKFLVGEHPTIVDCYAVPQLRAFTKGHLDHVDTKCLDRHPKIVEYVKRFCDLPAVKGRYETGLGSAAC